VLIETNGMPSEVASGMRRNPAVKYADVITGPYDVIALAEVSDLDEIAVLLDSIQPIKRVDRVMTCISLDGSLNS